MSIHQLPLRSRAFASRPLRRQVSRPIDNSKGSASGMLTPFQNIEDASERRLRWSLATLLAMPRMVLILCSHAILWPDSILYLSEARGFLNDPSHFPHEIFHTPLYPLFLSCFLALTPGSSPFWIVFVQHVLGVFSALLVFEVARDLLSIKKAFLAAALYGLSPLLLYYECVVQTELLFVTLLWAFLFAFSRWLRTPGDMVQAMNSGLLAGMVTLTRPVAQLLPCLAVGALLSSAPLLFRRKTLAALCFLGAYAFAILPWMCFNQQTLGFFGIAKGGGLNLYFRVFDLNQAPPPSNHSSPEVAEYYRAFHKPNGLEYMKVFRHLQKAHSAAAADGLMFQFAKEGIVEDPFTFVFGVTQGIFALALSPNDSVQFCLEQDRPVYCSTRPVRSPKVFTNERNSLFSSPKILAQTFWIAQRAFELICNFLICVGFLYLPIFTTGYFRKEDPSRNSRAILALFLMTAYFYFALISEVFNKAEDRYRLPVDPILFFSSFLFLEFAWTRMQSFPSRIRPGRSAEQLTSDWSGHTPAFEKYESHKSPAPPLEYRELQLDRHNGLHR